MSNYEIIEHTADIGIRVRGKDLKELFANSALAMFDIIGQKPDSPAGLLQRKIKKFNIKQRADNLEELFVNWLNELLSLSGAKELMFTGFIINIIDRNNLEADVIGEDIKNYTVNTEIKATTYHELTLKQFDKNWQAEVIFDV